VEGFGFIGGTILNVVYFLLDFPLALDRFACEGSFWYLPTIGAMGMMLAHVFENIGMSIGLMPVTGIPLPFLSYGGSNLLANMMTAGIVINVWMRRQQRR
jgi:rod shape determining protein RodA